MEFGVAQADELLATTRAVRRRLDFNRPVDNDQSVKDQLGELYAAAHATIEAFSVDMGVSPLSRQTSGWS